MSGIAVRTNWRRSRDRTHDGNDLVLDFRQIMGDRLCVRSLFVAYFLQLIKNLVDLLVVVQVVRIPPVGPATSEVSATDI